MILVELYVPSMDREYDFRLDETASILAVMEEVSELVAQKEQCSLAGQAQDLVLCHADAACILPLDGTLGGCGVKNGSRLVLV